MVVVQGLEGNDYAHVSSAGRGVVAGPGGVAGGSHVASGSAVEGPGWQRLCPRTRRPDVVSPARGPPVSLPRGQRPSPDADSRQLHFSTHKPLSAHRWFAGQSRFTPAHGRVHTPGPGILLDMPPVLGPTAGVEGEPPGPPLAHGSAGATKPPYYNYDYGNTVVYQGDNVCLDGQPDLHGEQYYQSDHGLANAGRGETEPPTTPSGCRWACSVLMRTDQTKPEMIFQLARQQSGRDSRELLLVRSPTKRSPCMARWTNRASGPCGPSATTRSSSSKRASTT